MLLSENLCSKGLVLRGHSSIVVVGASRSALRLCSSRTVLVDMGATARAGAPLMVHLILAALRAGVSWHHGVVHVAKSHQLRMLCARQVLHPLPGLLSIIHGSSQHLVGQI